jgi:hypothetical protein
MKNTYIPSELTSSADASVFGEGGIFFLIEWGLEGEIEV